MERGAFLYGLYSLAILGLFLGSTIYAWSPFADGGRVRPGAGIYGPTHK